MTLSDSLEWKLEIWATLWAAIQTDDILFSHIKRKMWFQTSFLLQ